MILVGKKSRGVTRLSSKIADRAVPKGKLGERAMDNLDDWIGVAEDLICKAG
jgi:hypothetical protein